MFQNNQLLSVYQEVRKFESCLKWVKLLESPPELWMSETVKGDKVTLSEWSNFVERIFLGKDNSWSSCKIGYSSRYLMMISRTSGQVKIREFFFNNNQAIAD